MQYCRDCGLRLGSDGRFCEHCSKPQHIAATTTREIQNKWLFGMIALVAVAIITAAVIVRTPIHTPPDVYGTYISDLYKPGQMGPFTSLLVNHLSISRDKTYVMRSELYGIELGTWKVRGNTILLTPLPASEQPGQTQAVRDRIASMPKPRLIPPYWRGLIEADGARIILPQELPGGVLIRR